MWSINFLLVLFALMVWAELISLRRFRRVQQGKQERLIRKRESLKEKEKLLEEQVKEHEGQIEEILFFYALTRSLSPILEKNRLFKTFCDQLKKLGQVEFCAGPDSSPECLALETGPGKDDVLYLRTQSKKIIQHLPFFTKFLQVCVERIDLYERLQKLSIVDSLTHVYNRRYVMSRFAEEFDRAKNFNLRVSFLMVDIDHFKKVNDTYGHLVGDVVLVEIAKIIRSNVRTIDFVARYGGEEFCMVLPETDKAGAIMVAERVRAQVSATRIKAFDERITVSVSVGVSSYPQNTLYQDVLIETADKALYQAKSLGRNRVCWF
ncbi:MAG: diguanylate cyclase [Candidatus Omnitrophica bacterium]|nr:diguanylate cyclase [Candidatus Omnitrophota bacterium]